MKKSRQSQNVLTTILGKMLFPMSISSPLFQEKNSTKAPLDWLKFMISSVHYFCFQVENIPEPSNFQVQMLSDAQARISWDQTDQSGITGYRVRYWDVTRPVDSSNIVVSRVANQLHSLYKWCFVIHIFDYFSFIIRSPYLWKKLIILIALNIIWNIESSLNMCSNLTILAPISLSLGKRYSSTILGFGSARERKNVSSLDTSKERR